MRFTVDDKHLMKLDVSQKIM